MFTGTKTATILSGAQLSDKVDLAEARLAGVIVPTGWTAANITFQASIDGDAWFDLYDSNGPVTIANAAAGRLVAVDPATFFGIRFLKVRSSVNQAADRAVLLSTTPR